MERSSVNLAASPVFSISNLISLGFDIDSPWGDHSLTTQSLYIGQGITLYVVDLREVFLEVDGKVKLLPGVKNIASLTSALLLFGCKVNISNAVKAMNNTVLSKV
ncbi:hypothetical protein [Sphingobacterium zeae]|uniref:hypothetical protein n=1 Tax=Sphingobacterium zeae TaxID=1776859 RepID=UPI00360BE9AC